MSTTDLNPTDIYIQKETLTPESVRLPFNKNRCSSDSISQRISPTIDCNDSLGEIHLSGGRTYDQISQNKLNV